MVGPYIRQYALRLRSVQPRKKTVKILVDIYGGGHDHVARSGTE